MKRQSMELLDKYFELQKQIFKYFGYGDGWEVIPFDDSRKDFWIISEEQGYVRFAKAEESLFDEGRGAYYENELYPQRLLSKWVYRTDDYTVVYTHIDGTKFLQIFDTLKERTYKD